MTEEEKTRRNLQPQALDAEEAVLGSMLSSKEAVSISIQWLNSECFYSIRYYKDNYLTLAKCSISEKAFEQIKNIKQ